MVVEEEGLHNDPQSKCIALDRRPSDSGSLNMVKAVVEELCSSASTAM